MKCPPCKKHWCWTCTIQFPTIPKEQAQNYLNFCKCEPDIGLPPPPEDQLKSALLSLTSGMRIKTSNVVAVRPLLATAMTAGTTHHLKYFTRACIICFDPRSTFEFWCVHTF